MSGTDGRRIYALGDLHGCLAALDERLEEIRADLAARPHDTPVLVCIGDYVDRGPDSKGVIDRLIAVREAGWIDTRFLLGNHDSLFLDFLQDPGERATDKYHWLDAPLGGGETLVSYGVERRDLRQPQSAHDSVLGCLPAAHLRFLEEARLTVGIGGYLFVHAGIRPGVPVEAQDPDDLIWIRDSFLTSTEDHGVVVIHGHTVIGAVVDHGNRIGIDTGAVFGGMLSCLVLEDDSRHLLAYGALHEVPRAV